MKTIGFQAYEVWGRTITNPSAVSKLSVNLSLKEMEFATFQINGTDLRLHSVWSNEIIRISLGTDGPNPRMKMGEIILKPDNTEIYRLPGDEVEYPISKIHEFMIHKLTTLKPSFKFNGAIGAFYAKMDMDNYIESILKEAKIASIMLP